MLTTAEQVGTGEAFFFGLLIGGPVVALVLWALYEMIFRRD